MRTHSIVLSTLPLALVCLQLAGCGVQYVANYDQTIVDGISSFLEKSEGFFILLERHAGSEEADYERCASFYEEAVTDLRLLRVHAAAVPLNDFTVAQLDTLMSSLGILEDLHRLGHLTPEQIEGSIRPAFESSCESILGLEYTKNR